MPRRLTFRSPHDPVALAYRLKAAVPERIERSTRAGVIGNGTDQKLELFYYRPGSYSDFASRLAGEIEADGGGSRIVAHLGMPPRTRRFMIFWFGFLAFFMVVAVPMSLTILFVPGSLSTGMWMVPAIMTGVPLLMVGLGALMLATGRRHRTRDEQAMIDFLARVAEAHPIEATKR